MLHATWNPEQPREWDLPGGAFSVPRTLDDLFAKGEKAAPIVDRNARWSGIEQTELVDALAGDLAEAGVEHGDLVGWQLTNSVESIIALRATWATGAVAVPVHHRSGEHEVARIRKDLEITTWLVPSGTTPTLEVHRGETPSPVPRVAPQSVSQPGPWSKRSMSTRAPLGAATPQEMAVVLHTSGSSGKPKGVMHTHRALAYKTLLMAEVHGLDSSDAVLMPAPLAHISGMLNGVLLPGSVPFKTVLMEKWEPNAAVELIESERVTFMVGPPTFFTSIVAASGFSNERVESLRMISVGGAGVAREFVERMEQELGATVKRSYGSTEAPTITSSTSRDSLESRADTEGRPLGSAEIMLSESGELLVRGPELFAGYIGATETDQCTEHNARGDWFRTGDLADIDGRGRLRITGRLKDVIIRGGENISAAEVEGNLANFPGIQEAAAVGVPDEYFGEIVCAFVQTETGVTDSEINVDELRKWLRTRGVSGLLAPERLEFVPEMPLLASGKVDKEMLRDRLV